MEQANDLDQLPQGVFLGLQVPQSQEELERQCLAINLNRLADSLQVMAADATDRYEHTLRATHRCLQAFMDIIETRVDVDQPRTRQ